MNTRTPLLQVLEEVLKAATAPMTCNDMVDLPQIKELVEDPRRVSDYLGNLWRKGLLLRVAAPPVGNSNARWAYQWREQKHPPRLVAAPAFAKPAGAKTHQSTSRPEVLITEDADSITIDLPDFRVTIKRKS